VSLSIYNILPYNSSTVYAVQDIVSYTGEWNGFSLSTGYLYCTTAGLGITSTPSTTSWDGWTTINGETKTKFIWIPSYGANVSQQPRNLNMKFGDGYESRMADGINNDLLTLELNFEDRGIPETTAILHFLTQRNGRESFVFTPQPPYSASKKFICRSWRDTQTFYGNYNIQAVFEETVN